MRALIAVAIVLSSCTTRIVELSAEDARTLDASFADAQSFPDAAALDAETADAAAPDAEPELDSGLMDLGVADSGTSCVCRFTQCRTDPDCDARLGAGSTCVRGTCTGGGDTCQSNANCAPGWTCQASSTSLDPC